MTDTQQKIYDFIVQYTTEHLYSPSVNDICEGTGLKSKSTVWHHLAKIERAGLIVLPEFSTPRAIQLVGYKLVKEQDYDKRVVRGEVCR